MYREVTETLQRPYLILDADCRVLSANMAFCRQYNVRQHDVQGSLIYDMGNGHWNSAELHNLLEHILPLYRTVRNFELSDTAGLSASKVLVNARQVLESEQLILLSIDERTSGKTPSLQPQTVCDAIQQMMIVIDTQATIFRDHGQDMIVRIPSVTAPTSIDPQLMLMVLGNVLSYVASNSSLCEKVTIAVNREETYTRIFISSEHQQPRIINPFAFIKRLKRSYGGHQSGCSVTSLSWAHQIMLIHGGSIKVAKHINRGVGYTIDIPLVAESYLFKQIAATSLPVL